MTQIIQSAITARLAQQFRGCICVCVERLSNDMPYHDGMRMRPVTLLPDWNAKAECTCEELRKRRRYV